MLTPASRAGEESETKNSSCVAVATRLDGMHCRGRIQQRSRLVHLARLDRAYPRRSAVVPADAFQTPRIKILEVVDLLQDCGLGADVQDVPTLECVDGFVRHQTHVRGLQVERLRTAPVEPHDRIE